MTQKTLKDRFNEIAQMYADTFVRTHFSYDDGSMAYYDWVAEEPGTILCVNDDMFFGFDEIRICIDENIPYDQLLAWYDYRLRLGLIDPSIPTPNLKSWVMGCPRMTEDQIQELEKAHKRTLETQNELQELIEKYKHTKNKF